MLKPWVSTQGICNHQPNEPERQHLYIDSFWNRLMSFCGRFVHKFVRWTTEYGGAFTFCLIACRALRLLAL